MYLKEGYISLVKIHFLIVYCTVVYAHLVREGMLTLKGVSVN